jgi:ribonuclease BN (tRNA processing enzyme)
MSEQGHTRVILLGTGAGPTPKLGRQPTAAALLHHGALYVIDCGNGVGLQLNRAGLALSSLRAIFITHHHLDHVADFGTLIAQAWAHLKAPVRLFGPPPLARMCALYRETFAIDLESRVAEEGRTPLAELMQVEEITDAGNCLADPGVRISCARVSHGALRDAFAYRFDCPDRTVVFSGDTTYSRALADFAKGADTLVHEAFYTAALTDPEFASSPALLSRLRRAHSSVEQAAQVAREAGVATLVLSPLAPASGIPDEAWSAAAAREFDGEIIVGRDLLEI